MNKMNLDDKHSPLGLDYYLSRFSILLKFMNYELIYRVKYDLVVVVNELKN